MNVFKLSRKAVDDLKSIGRYTQNMWGCDQRNKYLAKLDDVFHKIAREPQIGAVCDVRNDYRKRHVGKHVIYYLQKETHVKIVRILDNRMDVSIHII